MLVLLFLVPMSMVTDVPGEKNLGIWDFTHLA